jgi:hypothetical protein
MSDAEVTREGSRGDGPDREAVPGEKGGRRPRWRRSRELTKPDSSYRSYYGRPIIKRPGWKTLDIAGYLFLGGLAGASSVLAAAADATGRPRLARGSKIGALASITLSAAALIHDLGRPVRFLYMLRVIKPTSPMSVGTWILTVYAPAAGVAAVTDVTGLFPGSAATAAAGLGLMAAPPEETDLACGVAVFGSALELAASARMKRRLGALAEPYHKDRAGLLMRVSEVLTVAGTVAAVTVGRRNRLYGMLVGAALVAASGCTRFGVFEAGLISASDAKYTVMFQRRRPPEG